MHKALLSSLLFASLAVAAPTHKVTVQRRDLAATVKAPVVLESATDVEIAAPVIGTLATLSVDVGTVVRRGQVLGTILPAGQPAGGKAPLALKSPIDGVVANRPPAAGHSVAPTSPPLFIIIDALRLRAVAQVPEVNALSVRPGQSVELRFLAVPNALFRGTAQVTFPEIDATTRTRRVDVDVPNPDGKLLSGMTGSAAIRLAEKTGALVVPRSAITKKGETLVVQKVVGDKVGDVIVGVGIGWDGDSELVEVINGLAEGDTILVPDAAR